MNSIKKKLFFQIGIISITLVLLLLIANTLFLESYYGFNQKNKLIDYYDSINEMNTEEYKNSLVDFVSIETSSNIDILIMSPEGDILYTSNSYFLDKKFADLKINRSEKHPPGFKPQPPVEIIKTEEINKNVRFIWGKDPIFNNQNLMLSGILDNTNIIEMRLPIASIKKNIKLLNDFLIIIGAIVFLLSMGFAYLVSNNFTKPILQMNVVTKKMKNLDFEANCQIFSKDEIGELAESINEMSIELSKTIQTLNHKNIELQNEIKEKNRLDEKRRVLLNNVSHELKTPLTLMQGYAEGLKLNLFTDKEKLNFYSDVIIDESSKINQLVENLLDIDQMEFGDTVLNKTTFEINDFINTAFAKYSKVFEDKNIKYKINEINPIEVFADSFMLERVFTNYISNALNHLNDEKYIELNITKLEKVVRVEIFNTGELIRDKDYDKIWDSFYKSDRARTREKGGHGLGLSIVKSIQEAHDEKYGVKNLENGVSFWFDIRLK